MVTGLFDKLHQDINHRLLSSVLYVEGGASDSSVIICCYSCMRYTQHILFCNSTFCFHLIGCDVLHALRFSAGVIVSVTLKKVDDSPDSKTRAESDHERLKRAYCRSEKCHV